MNFVAAAAAAAVAIVVVVVVGVAFCRTRSSLYVCLVDCLPFRLFSLPR